ncbi:MAG: AtpZ/AtpI family protein [Acidimicrobiia bacterium]
MHKPPVKRESTTEQVAAAMGDGWLNGGSFVGSILAGALLGYLADRWLGTDPWLVIVGIGLGSYSGFMRMWAYSKRIEDRVRDR